MKRADLLLKQNYWGLHANFITASLNNTPEAGMTASVLKQDPNISKVKKNVYLSIECVCCGVCVCVICNLILI